MFYLNIITHSGDSTSVGEVTFDTLDAVSEFLQTDHYALRADELELFDSDSNEIPLPR